MPNRSRTRLKSHFVRAVSAFLVGGWSCLGTSLLCDGAEAQTVTGWGYYGFSNIDNIRDLVQVDGSNHTVVLDSRGLVSCWGRNDYGRCNVPTGLGVVRSVAVGAYHTVALKADGSVACWGGDFYGQCTVPIGLGSVQSVAAGGNHTVAVKADGSVACWGLNGNGECNVPVGLGSVLSVAAGDYHTVALKQDGTVACWGSNASGQCTAPANLGSVQSVAAGGRHTVALKQDGSVACWGSNNYGECNVPAGLGSVQSVAAGERHTVALKADGSVACWGSNAGSQCNVPADLGPAIAVGGGVYSSFAILTDGSLTVWGDDAIPPMQGAGGYSFVDSGCFSGSSHWMGVTQSGTVACWGNNFDGQCEVPPNLESVSKVAAGERHSVALRSDGSVACWGYNGNGECNVPAGLGQVTDIDAGETHSIALGINGLSCWGYNGNGQCTPPSTASALVGIAAGGGHSVALKRDGSVICWGSNLNGQSAVPQDCRSVISISAGSRSTAAVRADGSVSLFGAVSPPKTPITNAARVMLFEGNSSDRGLILRRDGTVDQFGCEECLPLSVQLRHVVQLAGNPIYGTAFALSCALSETVSKLSPDLGTLSGTTPREHTFSGLLPANGAATISVRVRGDFGAASEFAALRLDGQLWTVLFQSGGADCPATPTQASVTIPAKQFAALIADGSLVVRLEASPDVSAAECATGFTVIEVSYPRTLSDCNGNGFEDECELSLGVYDCNANGVLDACDLLSGSSADANGDGRPDECDADCNGNGFPDVGEIAQGAEEDCNSNGIPDICEKRTSISLSMAFAPIGYGYPARWTIPAASAAVEPVTLRLRARGDFGSTLEYLRLVLGSAFTADAFIEGADCAPIDYLSQTFVLTPDQFNAGIGDDGAWKLDILPSIAVDAMLCPDGSRLLVDVNYIGAAAADCNANSLLDSCEIASGWATDANGNGVPDECDSGLTDCAADLNGDGVVNALDLAAVLSGWGLAGSAADIDRDGQVDARDIAALLSAWGPCPMN